MNTTTNQMNLFEGRLARDSGVERTLQVEERAWSLRAMQGLVAYAKTRPEGFLAEEFRRWWLERCPPPHKDKVWGALFLTASRRGNIVNSGIYRQARSVKNHAHRYVVWRPAHQGEGA
jgi:hypothetical protein